MRRSRIPLYALAPALLPAVPAQAAQPEAAHSSALAARSVGRSTRRLRAYIRLAGLS